MFHLPLWLMAVISALFTLAFLGLSFDALDDVISDGNLGGLFFAAIFLSIMLVCGYTTYYVISLMFLGR